MWGCCFLATPSPAGVIAVGNRRDSGPLGLLWTEEVRHRASVPQMSAPEVTTVTSASLICLAACWRSWVQPLPQRT